MTPARKLPLSGWVITNAKGECYPVDRRLPRIYETLAQAKNLAWLRDKTIKVRISRAK